MQNRRHETHSLYSKQTISQMASSKCSLCSHCMLRNQIPMNAQVCIWTFYFSHFVPRYFDILWMPLMLLPCFVLLARVAWLFPCKSGEIEFGMCLCLHSLWWLNSTFANALAKRYDWFKDDANPLNWSFHGTRTHTHTFRRP